MARLTTQDERFAALAAALSGAARREDVAVADVCRVLRHELRRRNTNKALLAPRRSIRAQEVIDWHDGAGIPVPKNSSPDALHSDHVFTLKVEHLESLETQDQWLAKLPDLKEVVCVTAEENYRLEQVERAGADGWEKYELAGVALLNPPVA